MNWYVYDTQSTLPIVIQDKDNKYVIGLGLLYAVDDDDDAFFYHYDGSGSVVIVTEEDEDPRSRSRYQYNAYGETQDVDDFFEQPFMYAGQQNDSYDTSGMPNTGLYYMRARYYDPIVGRFITRDPYKGDIRSPQTLNPYLYALGNPANLSDPSGLIVYGPCYGVEVTAFISESGSLCYLGDSSGDVAFTVSRNSGVKTALAVGSGPEYYVSGLEVESVNDLRGTSNVVGGVTGEGVRGAVELEFDTQWNYTNSNFVLSTGEASLFGTEAYWYKSDTEVFYLFNAYVVRNKLIDWITPDFINPWLNSLGIKTY